MIWKPHMTVAALVERDGRFLMVEERVDGQLRYNQPAGHLEDGENLQAAAVRETLEETGWHFVPGHVTGIYRWRQPENRRTYIRVCFAGSVTEHDPQRSLDEGIEQVLWMSPEEIRQRTMQLRSPMVLRSLDDYLRGARFPLQLLSDLE
jgi:8-oxo-dGTP pyrophosphatase MutT (NUDIX family)